MFQFFNYLSSFFECPLIKSMAVFIFALTLTVEYISVLPWWSTVISGRHTVSLKATAARRCLSRQLLQRWQSENRLYRCKVVASAGSCALFRLGVAFPPSLQGLWRALMCISPPRCHSSRVNLPSLAFVSSNAVAFPNGALCL